MVRPNKNSPLTKEEEMLKKKLRKLFKVEEDSYIKPSSSNLNSSSTSYVNKKANTSSTTKVLTHYNKNSSKRDVKEEKFVSSKRRGPIINSPAKKIKKERNSYYQTQSTTDSDEYNECFESSKGSDASSDECCDYNQDDYNSDDSENFIKLTKLATKALHKEQRISKVKPKLNGHSSSDEHESKESNKKIKKSKKPQNKSKQPVKYSCRDYNDSSEDTSDDEQDGPAARGRKSNKNSRKSYNQSEWKTELVQDNGNDGEWESASDQEYPSDQLSSENTSDKKFSHLNGNAEIEEKIISGQKNKIKRSKTEKKSAEAKVKAEKTNDEHENNNSNINRNNVNKSKKNKKLKEAEITARKIKESNQKLVPYYNQNSNLTDNDSATEDIDEVMNFYGLESTDEDENENEDYIDEEEEDGDEYDFEESDSDDGSLEGEEEDDYDSELNEEEEDYDSEFSSRDDYESDDNDDYNFNDESNDEDYNLPDNHEEDLYIPQGIAIKYDINGYDVEFDSENEAQIIEIPVENVVKLNEVNTQIVETSIQNYESDDSCPQLVPISFDNQYDEQNNCDFSDSESEYSDCCSDYTEATEGSLCFQENQKDLTPPEATIMSPEIFDLSSENLQNHNSTLKQLDNCNSGNESEMEIDNPLEKIINSSMNISNTTTSYKITTIGGVEVNINSKIMQKSINKLPQKSINKFIKNNISNEFDVELSLDKFETKFYNAIDSCHVLVLLRDPIYIYGTIKLKLIAGNIEIFGYKPDLNETLEIFSPRGYSFLDIKAVKSKKTIDEKTDLSNIILQENYESIFLKFDLNDIMDNFNSKTDALILLSRNDCNKKIEMLRKYMKENLFPNMNSITLDRPFYSSEFILHCLIRVQSNNSIHIDPKWQTININSNTKTMIVGGKSVGKSTLIRYLINSNLKIFKKIVLIDLDIGQPELFIPQTISVYILDNPLLGPGYYLGLEPKKSLLFGDINAILSPIDYLKNIQNLLNYCQEQEEFQNLPWIINTMGYVKGFGNELIAAIIKYLQPTDIIQLQSLKSANNFDYLMYPNIVQTIPMNVYAENDLNINNNIELKHRLILFDSIMNGRQSFRQSSEWDMKSKDMRYAMIVTRLGAALNKCDWLTDVKPVCAPIDDIEIINFGEDHLTKEELLDVINTNLVYLCNKSTNNHIDCYGIGIIRGIDRFQRKIYLLPAVPIEILTNVNCFAVCNIPLPTSILLNQGPKVRGIVPYAYNTNKVIASKSVHQLYNRGQKRR